MDDLKNNKVPLIYYIKLRASFKKRQWIQTEVTVRKLSIRVKIGDFFPRVTLEYLEKQYDTSSILCQALCIISKPLVNSNWSYSPEKLNTDPNRWFFCPMWPWNLMDDLGKQQGTFPIRHQALCIISKPSVNSNLSYSSETLNSRQNRRFLSCVTLKFDEWPWRTIGHLFYVSSSLVHRFIAIREFKHELQSGDAKFGSKLMIFCSVWPWNLRKMSFKNNKAPLLYYFKLCVLFCSRRWIQTGVTVRKRPIWLKKPTIIFSCVTLKFDGWPRKIIWHIS